MITIGLAQAYYSLLFFKGDKKPIVKITMGRFKNTIKL